MQITQAELFLRFGVALGIGFLIGLQREFAHGAKRNIIAGERTFSLFGLAGALSAMIADRSNAPWLILGALFLLGAYSAIGYFTRAWKEERVGITSETATVIAFMLGILCFWGELTLAVALGIITTVILSLKIQTDKFVKALKERDIAAALQLAVISAIVLPILPKQSIPFPPLDVLNPFRIWLMVVFISAISFLGYILIKFVGANRGIGLTGLLGGIVSSTAVTMSFSSRSRHNPEASRPISQAIMFAWIVMFGRVLVEVLVLNLPLLRIVILPIAVIAAAGLLYSLYLYLTDKTTHVMDMEFNNPFSLSTAIKFGLVYAVVLLISRTAQHFWGDAGLVISSLIAGSMNMTAITLSLAELSASGSLALDLAAKSLLYAAAANTVTKSVFIYFAGSPALRKTIMPGAAIILLAVIGSTFLL